MGGIRPNEKNGGAIPCMDFPEQKQAHPNYRVRSRATLRVWISICRIRGRGGNRLSMVATFRCRQSTQLVARWVVHRHGQRSQTCTVRCTTVFQAPNLAVKRMVCSSSFSTICYVPEMQIYMMYSVKFWKLGCLQEQHPSFQRMLKRWSKHR